MFLAGGEGEAVASRGAHRRAVPRRALNRRTSGPHAIRRVDRDDRDLDADPRGRRESCRRRLALSRSAAPGDAYLDRRPLAADSGVPDVRPPRRAAGHGRDRARQHALRVRLCRDGPRGARLRRRRAAHDACRDGADRAPHRRADRVRIPLSRAALAPRVRRAGARRAQLQRRALGARARRHAARGRLPDRRALRCERGADAASRRRRDRGAMDRHRGRARDLARRCSS